jgi:hypothetical protein
MITYKDKYAITVKLQLNEAGSRSLMNLKHYYGTRSTGKWHDDRKFHNIEETNIFKRLSCSSLSCPSSTSPCQYHL